MDVKTAIDLAGGPTTVSRACTNRGMKVSTQAVFKWTRKNRLPLTEYNGDTHYAAVICGLAVANGHDITAAVLCPGAAQYLEKAKAA